MFKTPKLKEHSFLVYGLGITGSSVINFFKEKKISNFKTKKKRIFVVGGSQGAKIFSKIIPELLKNFDKSSIENLLQEAQKKQRRAYPSGGGRGPRGSSETKSRMSSTSVSNQRRASASSSLPIFRMALLMPIKSNVTAFATRTARSRSGPLGMAFLALPRTALRKSRSHCFVNSRSSP